MVYIDTRGIAAAMNKSGVVVGSDSANRAFAFVPRTSMLLNLNPVFGWTSGTAYSINDEGYILGSGDKLVDFGTAGLNSAVPRKISNSCQIVGTYVDPETNTQGSYLYTPGQPVVALQSIRSSRTFSLHHTLMLTDLSENELASVETNHFDHAKFHITRRGEEVATARQKCHLPLLPSPRYK
ncbi:MAG: hypothetical protein JWN70_4463 [Planctomycetaceae bacterium]|nr:hypothetical protein [Planctomycetaceae bacterium]